MLASNSYPHLITKIMPGHMDVGGPGSIESVIQRSNSSEDDSSDDQNPITGDLVFPTQELVSQVKGLDSLRKKLPDLSTLSNLRPGARRDQRILKATEDKAILEEAEWLAQLSQVNLNLEEARTQTQTEKDLFDAQIARQRVDLGVEEDTDTDRNPPPPSENVEPEKEKEPKEKRLLESASRETREFPTSESRHPGEEKSVFPQTQGGVLRPQQNYYHLIPASSLETSKFNPFEFDPKEPNLRPFIPGTPLHEFIHPSLIEDQHYTNLQGNLVDIPHRPLPKQLQLASATPIVTSRTPLTPSAPPQGTNLFRT